MVQYYPNEELVWDQIDDIKKTDGELEAQIDLLASEVEGIRNELALNNQTNFSKFFAYYDGNINPGENYFPLKFNKIEYNDGNLYNSSTGKVIIREDGFYQFSVQLRPGLKFS